MPAKYWNYERVIEYINKYSECKLISKEFANAKTKLDFKCKCGEEFETTFERFKYRDKQACNECSYKKRREKRRHGYDDVVSFVESKGCKLLSKEYENSKKKLLFECSCGNEFKTNIDNFRYGKNYCNECGRKKMGHKRTIGEFKELLKTTSCELISDYYVDGMTDLEFKCKCGNSFFRRPQTVISMGSYNCLDCSEKQRLKTVTKTQKEFISEIRALVGDEYSVLSEYKGAHKKVKVKHNSAICVGYEFELAAGSFLGGTRCPKCSFIKHSGEGSPRYNPLLTEKERLKRDMQNGELRKWRDAVYLRDNYECKICNKRGSSLNAHHLQSWNLYEEERFNVENGVTLCVTHHKEFHHLYGYGNNTKEEFEQFKNNLQHA